MCASHNFSVSVVAEWYSFCCCGRHKNNNMIFNQNEPQNISFERVAEDNTRWVRCTSIHYIYNYKVHIMLRFLWRLWGCRATLTGFRLWRQGWRHFLGSIFYGGIFPSKNGPVPPYWDTARLCSTSCAFLFSENTRKFCCIGRTYAVISP